MSNNTCHHIHQMKGFFHICFSRLTSMYTLVYQNNKKYQGPQLKWGILETLSESVICIYIACNLHRTVIGFKIVRIFLLNTIATLSGTLCPPFSYYLTSRLSFTTIKCTLCAFVHNIPYIWICMSCKLLKIFYYDRPKAIIDNICMLYKYTL